MYFIKLLAYEQKHKEPYNEVSSCTVIAKVNEQQDYHGAMEVVSFQELLECSNTKKAVDFHKLNPLRSVKVRNILTIFPLKLFAE